MSELPRAVADLIAEREQARAAKDFATADRLRDAIRAAGYLIHDGPDGTTWEQAPAFEQVDPRTIGSVLGEPATCTYSIHLLDEGFEEDLERFCRGLAAHNDLSDAEVVIVDDGGRDGTRIQQLADRIPAARAVHLDRIVGYAAARNAGLATAQGRIIIIADLSVEPTGDVLSPLASVFDDPEVGLAGPFGLVTADMFDFTEAAGSFAHAIEGYFMAIRREALRAGLFRERFTWYRNADIDLSFQVRSEGVVARVVSLPVATHDHRGWTRFPDDERDRLSRKNHAAFLRRWRDRTDLIEPLPD